MILHHLYPKQSHENEGAGFWVEAYNYFFPNHAAVIRHSQNGDHQRLGIDTTVVMPNSKTYRIDEKLRRGEWTDILLEEYSDRDRHTLGWIIKPVLCDFFLYAVPAAGKAYLLPCGPLQAAWRANADQWRRTCKRITVDNHDPATGRTWTSINWAVEENVLFPAIGAQFRLCLKQG
ncbi:MAG: hypothetical protein BWY09_01778 [Candidatus Hydrogenedentes bacterium ADurb.Bin179]|nr:MAG: hypothetical protein BWY09_01778 [Candidatus Hydrogenedentes bacterium ADurb.Bin179]